MKTKQCYEKHTPTPWKVLPGTYNGDYKIVMDDKRWANPHQGYVMTCGNDQQANAAFIIRVVNAHEELLKAAKLALEVLQSKLMDSYVQQGLRSAIAKAEGR